MMWRLRQEVGRIRHTDNPTLLTHRRSSFISKQTRIGRANHNRNGIVVKRHKPCGTLMASSHKRTMSPYSPDMLSRCRRIEDEDRFERSASGPKW